MNIEKILAKDFLARKKLVEELEKKSDEKIVYQNMHREDIHFMGHIEAKIIAMLQDFKAGDEIVMNHLATSEYGCTQEESKGRVISSSGDSITVDFYYQTGKRPPEQSNVWEVGKKYAYKEKFYELLRESKDYKIVAKEILSQIIGDNHLFFSGKLEEYFKILIGKLIEKENISLINDESFLQEIKDDSLYFKIIDLQGARKYLRGVGVVRLTHNGRGKILLEGKNIEKVIRKYDCKDCDSAKLNQIECSEAIAELNIIEEAKKAGANYVLIKQKHILASQEYIISIIEGTPMNMIGDKEIKYLLNIPDLEEKVIEVMKELLPKEIKSNYMGLARFYPQEFITYFSEIEDTENKKQILKSLLECDYDNKEVIDWLNKNESKLIRDVGMNLT